MNTSFRFKLLNGISIAMFSLGMALFVYVMYLMLWPVNPIVIHKVTIVTPTVPQGGTVIYRIDSCKHTDMTPTITQKIVSDTAAESIPSRPGTLSQGCSVKDVPLTIQPGTPPGTYTLYTDVMYQMNALRIIHVYWKAGPFTVTKAS